MSGDGGETVETKEIPRRRVLIVDDELGVRESLRMALKGAYDVMAVGSGPEALESLTASPPDVVLLDIVMPGVDGMQLLEELRGRFPNLPVVKTAVQAMKLGAFHYITKPFDVEDLRAHLDKATEQAALVREVEELRTEVGRRYQIENIIGRSARMQAVFKTVLTVAPLKTTVLITGESGTGKELIAKAIHYQSPRARRPLVTLNCAAIPETLLESELFGHEKGSFTDAHTRKLGQFELAHEGTLFLDEIGEMGPATQAKLLRVLEHGEFLRVGGTKPICVDVRIIAATNRDLALDTLMRYHWPGNVRELENLIERLLVLCEGPTIDAEDLPDQVRRSEQDPGTIREQVLQGRKSLGDAVDEFEREIIVEALGQTDFNQTRAAELLGTTRRILKYRMDKLGIAAPDR